MSDFVSNSILSKNSNSTLSKSTKSGRSLVSYWKLILLNKYISTFFNYFFRGGKKYKSIKLFQGVLFYLKKTLLLPPLFVVQQALMGYKNVVRMRTKQFRRKKFYYFSLLSGDRQVRHSIGYLCGRFKDMNTKSSTRSSVESLANFILNLYYKTSGTYGKFLVDQMVVKKYFDEIRHKKKKMYKKKKR